MCFSRSQGVRSQSTIFSPFHRSWSAWRRRAAGCFSKADACGLGHGRAKRIMDGMPGLWCVNVGHLERRQEIVEASARADESEPLLLQHPFFKTTHPPVIELSAMLAESRPRHIQHGGFTAASRLVTPPRHDIAAGAHLLGASGQGQQESGDQPQERLSRLHHRRGLARRHGRHAQPGRIADPPTSTTSISLTGSVKA